MSILAATIDHLHGRAIAPRRARVLAGHVVRLLPAGGRTILDVGCGDGAVGRAILAERPYSVLSLVILEMTCLNLPMSASLVNFSESQLNPSKNEGCNFMSI